MLLLSGKLQTMFQNAQDICHNLCLPRRYYQYIKFAQNPNKDSIPERFHGYPGSQELRRD